MTLLIVANIANFSSLFLNSLPNDNFWDWTKFKSFADDKFKVTKLTYFFFFFGLWYSKTIVGNGESAGYQHFLLFPQCFLKACFSGE